MATDPEWYRFDDKKVESFDLADLETETFGGQETMKIDVSSSRARTAKVMSLAAVASLVHTSVELRFAMLPLVRGNIGGEDPQCLYVVL